MIGEDFQSIQKRLHFAASSFCSADLKKGAKGRKNSWCHMLFSDGVDLYKIHIDDYDLRPLKELFKDDDYYGLNIEKVTWQEMKNFYLENWYTMTQEQVDMITDRVWDRFQELREKEVDHL